VTCAEMFERMLEADLSELRLDAASPLAAHLRTCTRCRSIAARVRHDTSLLATAVARRHARRNSAVRRYAAVAVAASLCVVLARSWPTADQARVLVTMRGAVVAAADTISADDAPPSSVRTVPATSLRAHVAKQRSAPPAIATTGGAVTNPVRPQRLAVAVAERPRSIAAIRLQETPDTPLGSTVSADPTDRKRAIIIRTANPAITVVWLQD